MQRWVIRSLAAAMLERQPFYDLAKLACSGFLFASPWIFEFGPTPAWNLWVWGYVMMTAAMADLVAEADWEPRTNFCLGVWVVAAPWMLGFLDESTAMFVHVAGGSLISILSGLELWNAERNPPWRFRPGAACRGELAAVMTGLPQMEAYPGIDNGVLARSLVSTSRRRRLPQIGRSGERDVLRRRRHRAPVMRVHVPGRNFKRVYAKQFA